MYLSPCSHTISLYMLIGRPHTYMLIFFIMSYLLNILEILQHTLTYPKLNLVILNLQLLLFSFVFDIMNNNIIYP